MQPVTAALKSLSSLINPPVQSGESIHLTFCSFGGACARQQFAVCCISSSTFSHRSQWLHLSVASLAVAQVAFASVQPFHAQSYLSHRQDQLHRRLLDIMRSLQKIIRARKSYLLTRSLAIPSILTTPNI